MDKTIHCFIGDQNNSYKFQIPYWYRLKTILHLVTSLQIERTKQSDAELGRLNELKIEFYFVNKKTLSRICLVFC
jgi:hypothetical protein